MQTTNPGTISRRDRRDIRRDIMIGSFGFRERAEPNMLSNNELLADDRFELNAVD
jgi:hypothetical protein